MLNKIGFGFGLERLGLLAFARPKLVGAFILMLTAISIWGISQIQFRGSVTGVLPQTGERFLQYQAQKSNFRNFSRDVAIIIQSPDLMTRDGFSRLREMQLDMALEDGVVSAISILSLPNFNQETKAFESFFPAEMTGTGPVSDELDQIFERYPQARSLIAENANAAILLVALDLPEDDDNDQKVFELYRSLVASAGELAPEGFNLHFSGMTPISLSILEALKQDQAVLTIAGIIFGGIVAWIFFGNAFAALFCSIPAILAAVWGLGFLGVAGVPVTYMTTVLPSIAMVLAYADGVILFHTWLQKNKQDADSFGSLWQAIKDVGPAAALTSLTTAVALGSFALSQSEALQEFAWLGLVLVSLAFVSVITAIPVMGVLLLKSGFELKGRSTLPGATFGSWFYELYQQQRLIVIGVSAAITLSLFYAHQNLSPNYRVTELLPRDGDTLVAEEMANELFGGRSLVFVTVPVAVDGGISEPENQARLFEVETALQEEFGTERVYSIAALLKGYNEEVRAQIVQSLDTAPEYTRQGYISKSGTEMLLSLRLPSSHSIKDTREVIGDIRSSFDGITYANEIVLTGFPVLLATEFYDLINLLRNNLLIAALFGVVLIGLVTHSVKFAAAALVPNFLPILFVEGALYVNSGVIGITDVIALTIGLGIAIDNTIHIINAYRLQEDSRESPETLMRRAIRSIAPALGFSALIICVGVSAGLISSLPIMVQVAGLIIATILVALVSNLLTLPAYILTLYSGQTESDSNK